VPMSQTELEQYWEKNEKQLAEIAKQGGVTISQLRAAFFSWHSIWNHLNDADKDASRSLFDTRVKFSLFIISMARDQTLLEDTIKRSKAGKEETT